MSGTMKSTGTTPTEARVGSGASTDQLEAWDIAREMCFRIAWKPYMYSQTLPYLLGAVREVVAGHADFSIVTIFTGAPFVKEGKVKALVVTGSERSKALPNVPSLAEAGGIEALKGYGGYAIYALLGPSGMPPATTQLLSDAIVKISRMPDVAQKLEAANVRPSALTPKELTAYLDKEIGKWKEVGKKVKID